MLPIDVDYSYSDVPIHLAQGFTNSDREIFDTYFGGVTMFPIDLFKKVNGYSNEYWGWGFEDDDLLMRLTEQTCFTDTNTMKFQKITSGFIYTETKVMLSVQILFELKKIYISHIHLNQMK